MSSRLALRCATRGVVAAVRPSARLGNNARAAVAASRGAVAAHQQGSAVWRVPQQARFFGSGLTQSDVAARVVDVIKKMEKIDESVNVTENSHWLNDLGLDSLDAVEVVMAIEDEFSIEITDGEMEKMQTTADAIQLVMAHPQAK